MSLDRKLRDKRDMEERRAEYWRKQHKIDRAKNKGEEALSRIRRLEQIIAYANFEEEEMPSFIKEDLRQLREEVDDRIDYKSLFIDKFKEKLFEEVKDKDVKYVKDGENRIFTIRDDGIYNYYSTKEPDIDKIIKYFECLPLENEFEEIVNILKNNEDIDYKNLYNILI